MILGEDETNVSARLRCKSASAPSWMVTEFGDDLLDSPARLLTDVWFVIEDKRYSGNGQGSLLCDIADGEPAFHGGISRNVLTAAL